MPRKEEGGTGNRVSKRKGEGGGFASKSIYRSHRPRGVNTHTHSLFPISSALKLCFEGPLRHPRPAGKRREKGGGRGGGRAFLATLYRFLTERRQKEGRGRKGVEIYAGAISHDERKQFYVL